MDYFQDLTKSELISELTRQGIETTVSMTKRQLLSLFPKKADKEDANQRRNDDEAASGCVTEDAFDEPKEKSQPAKESLYEKPQSARTIFGSSDSQVTEMWRDKFLRLSQYDADDDDDEMPKEVPKSRFVHDQRQEKYDAFPFGAKKEDNSASLEKEVLMLRFEMEKMNREADFARREADLAAREIAYLRKIAETPAQNRQQNKWMSVKEISDAMPEFNPSGGASPNVRVFVRRIKTLAERYGWNDDLVLLAVKPKLKGSAGIWANSLEEELLTLEDFLDELTDQFAGNVSEMELHEKMKSRFQKNDELTQDYVFEMCAMGRNGGMKEPTIVQYILKGIRDAYLRQVAMSSCPANVTRLLTIIRFYEGIERPAEAIDVMTNKTPKMTVSQPQQQPAPQKSLETRRTECYNCFEAGHIAKDCPKPQRRPICQTCRKVGHESPSCPSAPSGGKVNRIQIGDNFQPVRMNDKKMVAFVDLGSDVTTLRESDKDRLKLEVEDCQLKLAGFAGGSCSTIGRATETIELSNNVRVRGNVHIVPDGAQNCPLIIGRDVLDDQVVVRMRGETTIFPIADAEANFKQMLLVLSLEKDLQKTGMQVEGVRKPVEVDRNQTKKKFERVKRCRMPDRKPTTHEPNDLGLLNFATGESRKLQSQYRGPGNDRYKVVDTPTSPQTQRPFRSVNATDRMKPWCRMDNELQMGDDKELIEDDQDSQEGRSCYGDNSYDVAGFDVDGVDDV